VYGTLRSEFDNDHARLLRSQAERIGSASVPGAIFLVAHYPAYRPEPRGEVRGEVYRLENPEAIFRILDEYEAPAFERVWQPDPGPGFWLYRFTTQPPEKSRIESGDFCRR